MCTPAVMLRLCGLKLGLPFKPGLAMITRPHPTPPHSQSLHPLRSFLSLTHTHRHGHARAHMHSLNTQKKYSAVEQRGGCALGWGVVVVPTEGATLNWESEGGGLRRNGWLTRGLLWQSGLFFSPSTQCLFFILGLIVG